MTNIIEKIADSQMVLVGLGEELDFYRRVKKSPEYRAACEKVENADEIIEINETVINKGKKVIIKVEKM